MASRHLLNLSRRSKPTPTLTPPPLFTQPSLSASSSSALAPQTSLSPSPLPPNAMVYDRLSEEIKSKLKRLENPDPRLLRYTSPHTVLTDHTLPSSNPETNITTLPTGFVRPANLA